jgi:hypothetical protein
MVRILLSICFYFLSISAIAQIALLDEISQLDQERDRQLLHDKYKNTSFLVRATSDFLKIQPKKQVKIWKNITWDGIDVNYTVQSNSKNPSGFNDGNLFPSIGSQNRVGVRSRFIKDNFELNIQPEFVSARNINPPVFLGYKQDGNYWARYYLHIQNNIDYYTQYGRKPITALFPGQSFIAYHSKHFTFGISSENQWWGSGVRNSLMMTNNAAGFYHGYIKTNKPIETKWGSFEGKAMVGQLDAPQYPPTEDSLMRTIWAGGIVKKNNSLRHIEGFTIQWQPKWIPNLYVGYTYLTQSYILNRNIVGKKMGLLSNDRPKQKLGAFVFRFVLPNDHAEFYAEIGQPNQAVSPWRFFGDSVRTGFVVGARKLFPIGNKGAYLKLYSEFTQLQLMNPALVINVADPFGGPMVTSWYTSNQIRQGYTHQGQILGASIGPGSNSQTVGLSWHKGKNKIGLFMERVANNNDFYTYQYYGSTYFNRYYININKGLELQYQVNNKFLLTASALQTNAINYRWVREELPNISFSESSPISDRLNLLINFSLKYSLYAGR